MAHPYLESGDDSFQKDVLDFKGVTLVDFWATWCGPCQLLAPIIEDIATENAAKKDAVRVVKIDVDQSPKTSDTFGIRSIPTIGFFKDGKLVDQVIGVQTKDELVRRLEAAQT